MRRNCAPIVIVCDGYKLIDTMKRKNPYSFSKSGFILEEAARTYEAYKTTLQYEIDHCENKRREYILLPMKEHMGFALSVKNGLNYAENIIGSTHALILQHDRVFTNKLHESVIPRLLKTFDDFRHIRYMGFPTTASFNYLALQHDKFRGVWDQVQKSLVVPIIGESNVILLPSMFWYDSNHLVQIDRMLEMYTPFLSVPSSLHETFGGKKGLKSLYLRKGDFIEDRMGQQQRKLFNALADEILHHGDDLNKVVKSALLDQVVKHFGCYLIAPILQDSDAQRDEDSDTLLVKANILIMHVKGRTRPAPQSRKMVY